MGKRKSNTQKREIAARQKINKTRKAEKLRQVLKRDFTDMTPTPKWLIDQDIKMINDIKRITNLTCTLTKDRNNWISQREILFRKF